MKAILRVKVRRNNHQIGLKFTTDDIGRLKTILLQIYFQLE